MSIVDSVKRAPRWAWITAAGVGIGAGAIKLYNDRGAESSEEGVETVDGAQELGTGVGSQAGAGYPGIIVPPIVTGASGDQGSAVAGMSVWADAVGDVVDILGGVTAGLTGSITDISLGQQGLIGQMYAGGAPGQAVSNPSPIVVNVPAPQAPASPVPQAGKPQAPAVRVKDTCHTGYNKDGDCWTCTVTRYTNGDRKLTNCHKVHKGKCGKVVTCP